MKNKTTSPSPRILATASDEVAVTGQRAVTAKGALKLAKARYKSAKKTLKRARKTARKAAKLARKARRHLDKLKRQIPVAKDPAPAIRAKNHLKRNRGARLAALAKPAASAPPSE